MALQMQQKISFFSGADLPSSRLSFRLLSILCVLAATASSASASLVGDEVTMYVTTGIIGQPLTPNLIGAAVVQEGQSEFQAGRVVVDVGDSTISATPEPGYSIFYPGIPGFTANGWLFTDLDYSDGIIIGATVDVNIVNPLNVDGFTVESIEYGHEIVDVVGLDPGDNAVRIGIQAGSRLFEGDTVTITLQILPPYAAEQEIAFVSSRDGNFQIYSIRADRSRETRLTDHEGFDFEPLWSPEGASIAFESNRDGPRQIYGMDASGANQINLTSNGYYNLVPRWSPDGSKILFFSTSGTAADIYVMDADGSNRTNLTNNGGADAWWYGWSPDGERIWFQSYRDGNAEIYSMYADGSGQKNLTNDPSFDGGMAQWSPDGSKIVFVSDRDNDIEIYAMSEDGANQTNLTHSVGSDENPEWSPDGSRIIFQSRRDGNEEIYVMNADGSDQTRLTTDAATDFEPHWSPDGELIMFTSDRDGEPKVYIMHADGSGQVKLTNSEGGDFWPQWAPLPALIRNLLGALIEDVGDLAETSALKAGQANGLTTPLKNALRSNVRGHSAATCSQIEDFIDEVQAKTPDVLPVPTSEALIKDATAIQTLLGCEE